MPENLAFSFEIAQELYTSPEQFPIHFDDAWQWLDYSRKDSAKRNFEKAGFIEGIDFELHKDVELRPQGGYSNRDDIYLSCECFKQWGMMAGTEKGHQVRLYFLKCERIAKSVIQPKEVSVKDELDVLNFCLTAAGIDSKLTAGVMLNHAGVRMPQLKIAIAESHNLLAAAGRTDLLLTPTKIGKELGVSGRKVNQALLDLGFQTKNNSKESKTEPDYLVTEIGKPYAGNTMATGKLQDGKPDNTTYQHLKWKESVIEIVGEQLAS
jgi:phage anti-repressor protein